MADAARGSTQEQGGPAGPDPQLALPEGFGDSPLWRDPAFVGWYVRLQLISDAGRLEGWSLRNVATWLRCSFNQARRFIAALENAGLLAYPEGLQSNRAYPVELRDYWGPPHTADHTADPPKPTQRKKPVTTPTPPSQGGRTTQQNGELFPGIAAQQKNGNGASSTNRLMQLIHVMGLDEDPLCTGALWAKQAEVVRRMVEQHGDEATEAAIRGVPHLFPWSEPDAPPWDAFIVERHFIRAVAAHGRAEAQKKRAGSRQQAIRQHIQNQEDQERAERLAVEDWQKRIKARIRKEPEDLQWRYVRKAEKQVEGLPLKDRDSRKKLAAKIALRLYGEDQGDPPPGR